MTSIEVSENELVVNIEGFDKILAMRGRLTVPLSHVKDVTVRPDISSLMRMEMGATVRGVHVPDSVLVGSVRFGGSDVIFADVRDPSNAIAIELEHDQYRRLILEVRGETPEAVRDRILAAVRHAA